MICVSIGHARHRMMIMEHQALAKQGVELVEYRIDCIASQPQLARLLKHRPTPCIVTCRRESDGGHWKGTEEQRLALLRSAIVSEVAYVDLEDDIAGDVPRYGKTKRIVSHHNFEETPENLEEIHSRMCELDPDIVKLVTMAGSPADAVRILKIVAESKVPTVGFCMGEYGIPSRILCGKYGSPFTFAAFKKGKQLAPGQLTLDEMQSLYRYDSINRETQVFGVIGDPIGHSLSPLIHNAAFQHEQLNCVYLPFRIPAGDLTQTLTEHEWLDVRGYSVTIPHKQAALDFAQNKDPASVEIGAANTLFRDNDGNWNCTNTDYNAALASLQLGLNPDVDPNQEQPDLSGKRVLMLGAGGVACAVGLGVVQSGGELTITNRTAERAEKLAAELKC
ncbi:MAG: type I 3-dehydroquinate dehydratase, partial [Planctomycetes bacterium]|nr:type I 3-dehydroquinate dehydratase [Planctomycetota bacterium]